MEQFDTPMVWLSSLWSKVNIFGWRLRRNFLLCNLNLTLRGIHAPSLSCSLCMEDCESTEHVILGYSFIVKLRNLVASWWGIKLLFLWDMTNLYSQDTLNLVPKNYRNYWEATLTITAWAIWHARNERITEGTFSSLLEIFSNIHLFSYHWINNRRSKTSGTLTDWISYSIPP